MNATHVAILGRLGDRRILKLIRVPEGQSLDFDPGPGAERRWLHEHLGGEWHLIEFAEIAKLEAVAPYVMHFLP